MPRRKQPQNLKKIIKNMIAGQQETKTVIQQFQNTAVTTTGVNYDVTSIGQGTSQQQRIGNTYKLTSFRLKGALFHGSSDDLCRIILYIPKDPTVLIPTSLVVTDPVDLDQFNVLSDRLIPLSDHGPACKLYNKVLLFNRGKRTGLNVRFSDATAASIMKGRLMIYMVSFSSGSPHPTFKGWWRAYFKDA